VCLKYLMESLPIDCSSNFTRSLANDDTFIAPSCLPYSGFVNCGCQYEFKKEDEHNGTCGNEFPKCPGLEDVNANFGNGW